MYKLNYLHTWVEQSSNNNLDCKRFTLASLKIIKVLIEGCLI